MRTGGSWGGGGGEQDATVGLKVSLIDIKCKISGFDGRGELG